jgi:hypothetical protein
MLRTPGASFLFFLFQMLTVPFSLIPCPLRLALPLPRVALASSCRLRRVAPSPRVAFTTSPPSRHLYHVASVASPCRVAPSPRVPPLPCPPPRVAPSPRVAPRHTSPLRHALPSLRSVPICGGNGGELVSGWVGGNASAGSIVV